MRKLTQLLPLLWVLAWIGDFGLASLRETRADDVPREAPSADDSQAELIHVVAQNPGPSTTTVVPSVVESRLAAMQSELAALQRRLAADELEIQRLRSTDVPTTARSSIVSPKIQMTGLLQTDAGFFQQPAASVATFGDIQDVAGFRRARLAAIGEVAPNITYMLEVDFAGPGRPNFLDMWVDVHEFPLIGNVRIGQWRQPFHMDSQTSIRELMFLEPALSQVLAPGRQIGIGIHDTDDNLNSTWAISGFRFPSDAWGDVGSPEGIGARGDRGYGASGRATGLLAYDETGPLVHLGGAYAYLSPGSREIIYRTPPEFGGPFVGSAGNLASIPFFADTKLMALDTGHLFGLEFAFRAGSLYGQSEMLWSQYRDFNGQTIAFPTAYGQLAYLLTGEIRPYNRTAGVFGRVEPLRILNREGWGAWEVAVRCSYLDLNQVGVTGNGAPGGRLTDLTAGLNWYLAPHAKLQFNYISAHVDRLGAGLSDTNIFAFRAQVDF